MSLYCKGIRHFLAHSMTKIVGKFQLCHQHARNPSYTNLLILKYINNVTHIFLRNTNLDRNFSLSGPLIVLTQFIKLFLVKVIGCCHMSSTLLFVTQISSSWFTILTFFGPVTHSAHTNTVITTDNLHFAANSNWTD
jgi:hypothetical protein